MAGSAPQPNRRKRRSAAPGPAPAPSRIHNERQQQIVDTVEGYESTLSFGAALQAILMVWVVVGALVLGLGVGILVLGSSETGASLRRTYQALGYGMAILMLVTMLAALVWSGQAFFNVSKIGRTPSIGQVGVVSRHIPGIVIGAGMLFAATLLPDFERPLQIIGGAALVWGLLILAGLGNNVLQMLWRSSDLGDSAAVDANRNVTIWFAGIVLMAFASTAVETLTDITLSATGFLIILVGIGILMAAAPALRFVPAIAQRQEARVVAILESYYDEEDSGQQPVTAQQIEDAWQASSDLFTVDGH